jgi:hypothetical protein
VTTCSFDKTRDQELRPYATTPALLARATPPAGELGRSFKRVVSAFPTGQ